MVLEMKRNTVNLIVDLLALIAMVATAFSGIVLKYILPHGNGHGWRGGRGEIETALFWNMSKHDWNEIHFGLAAVLMVLVAIHLALHWQWIKSSLTRKNTMC